MIDAWGIQHRWEDASGVTRDVDATTVEALRELIGRPDESRPGPLLVRAGVPVHVGPAVLRLEDGTETSVADTLPPDVPVGYHSLHAGDGDPRPLIVHPGGCPEPRGPRRWGLAVQLYAARSRASWGMGDLADLRRVARWTRDGLGGRFVLANPLGATTRIGSACASPYFPSTRRFLNPIYLRIEEVPGAEQLGAELDALAARGRALNTERTIDRDAVWALKRAALERLWSDGGERADFAAWYREQGGALRDFATWCTLAEKLGPCWRDWAPEYRHPNAPGVARFRADHDERVRFHAWLQWLATRGLGAAADELPLLHDLPIGFDPDGLDAWQWQDLLAPGARIGAPPDAFNQLGQDWGLPPFVPWRLRAAGYRPFIDTIAATLRFGGGLRVDHVMGLFRLWWIPPGAEARGGAYVRYPAEDLLAILAIESQRAEAVVVGEDLGTVEDEARRLLAHWNVLSYRLLWFEPSHPATWPSASLGAVTTHDLPTVRGLWDGSDVATQRRLGLAPNEAEMRAIRDRLAAEGGLAADATPDDAIRAAHRLLARAPSRLLAVTLDDAAGEAERPNVPGADGHPNWSLALRAPLETLETERLPCDLAALMRAEGP